MWIVSQDGELIINSDTMQGISRTASTIRIWHDGKVNNLLGTYSTEEKAKTIMKQLIDSQVKFLVLKNIEDVEPDLKEYLKERQYGVITAKGCETEISSLGNQVFFMPQDEEVVV